MTSAAKIHIIAAVFALFAAGAGFATWSLIHEARSFSREAIERSATIRTLEKRESYNTQNRTHSTDYYVTVTYTEPKSGEAITVHRATKRVSRRFFNRLEEGQDIPIKMLPLDPKKVEIEPGWVRGNAVAAGIMTLFFLACAGGVEWLYGAYTAKRKALKTRGLEALARVRYTSNWNGPMMELSFWDRMNSPKSVSLPRPKEGLIDGLEDGGDIPIIYDPDGRYNPMLKAQLT